VLREVVEKYPQDQVSVHVIWLPMVLGDDEAAARSTGKLYRHGRVQQYYDGDRVVGLAYVRDVFPHCLEDALSVMPKDHPLYAPMSERSSTARGSGPLWDAVLFYPAGVEWKDRAPAPAAWSKQVGFVGPEAAPLTGSFFRNDCKMSPTDSDWHDEVWNGMRVLKERRRAGGPPELPPIPSRSHTRLWRMPPDPIGQQVWIRESISVAINALL
jgi:hypothetical protein